MTTDERNKINRFIAEKCGWKSPDHPDTRGLTQGWSTPEKWWMNPEGELEFAHCIPDYTGSLDQVHEATQQFFKQHGSCLDLFEALATVMRVPSCSIALPWATAEQRAVALYLTMGGEPL
jgi:hypothetical protein